MLTTDDSAKTVHLAVRVQPEMLERLKRAAQAADYSLTVSQILTRGIKLVLRELERKKKRGARS